MFFIVERFLFFNFLMKYPFLFFYLLLSLPALAQKDTERIFDAGNIDELEIILDEVYKIDVQTHKGSEVVLISHSEGEYYNDIHVEMDRQEEKLIFTSKYSRDLQGGFDKLSAHKVFSLEVTLKVPENLLVYIKSNIATVSCRGQFKDLRIELQTGKCILNNFTGNAVINTYRGSIQVETQDATISAVSRNGTVYLPEGLQGNHRLELQSIYGDIRVLEN